MKKIFNVATYKRDEFLFKTIESIYNQSDIINVLLNSHIEIPKQLIDNKINCFITDNSIGDGFKFLRLDESDGYYFTIDDDIIYPPNYSDYLIDSYNKYNGKYIVTLHGRSFLKFPITSYYRSQHVSYRCLGDVNKDTFVQFGGTGVMMFHTNLLKFSHKNILKPNMADIWLSIFAREKNISIMCLKHDKNFLKYQKEVGNETIYDNYRMNDNYQTKIINERYIKK
jgi:hypothetical protein